MEEDLSKQRPKGGWMCLPPIKKVSHSNETCANLFFIPTYIYIYNIYKYNIYNMCN